MKKIALLVSLAICFTGLLAQKKVDFSFLDKTIPAHLKAFEIPGCAIAIVKDGETVYAKGFGEANTTTHQKITTTTVFGIASLSKAFTAAAVASLVDQGKLKWSTRVQEVLPNFRLHDDYVSRTMNIADLLSHRIGLATFDGDLLWYGTNYSREEILSRIQYLPLKNGFREQWGYQNIMYIAAGEIVAAVSGTSWEKYIATTFAGPLKMDQMAYSTSQYNAENWAHPHIHGKVEQFLNYDNSGGAAALNASVTDLAAWMKMLLQEGNYNGQQILSKQSVAKLGMEVTTLPLGNFDKKAGTHFKGYGMGWFVMDFVGVKVMHHGGGLPGFISKIALVPEKNYGVVILTNGESSLPTALMYQIIEYIEKGTQGPWVNTFLEYKNQSAAATNKVAHPKVQNTQPGHKLQDYCGMYEDKMYGMASVELENDSLVVRLIPTQQLFTATLNHWHYDTFQFQFADPFLPQGWMNFSTNLDGIVDGFVIDLPNPDFNFYNLNFKRIK